MKAYKYSDVCLVPRYSECYSRSDADTSIKIGNHSFKLPVIPANMKSVIDINKAKWMSENEYFYIMHRFDRDLLDDVTLANSESWKTISFSVGVKMPDKIGIMNVSKNTDLRVDFLTIDIAHGHCDRMKRMIRHIKKYLPDTIVIAGNVATPDAVVDLANWGADIVKVGIGQGSPCTTKDKTGFTIPMFTCVKNCGDCYASRDDFDAGRKIPIIADGGVVCNGDIAKALVAGGDMVMAGGLFASCTDSPALTVDINGSFHKAYFGSASYENKGHNQHIEGKLNHIVNNGMTYENKLIEIQQDLQSSISYAGGKDLSCLKDVKHFQL
jgi:GMP reductase